MEHCHALVMSDLHLGNPICDIGKAKKTLRRQVFDELIISGDLFDCFDFEKMPKSHLEFLCDLNGIAKVRKCTLIRGNHEMVLSCMGKNFKELIPDFRIMNEYLMRYADKKYLFIHGHENIFELIKNLFRPNKDRTKARVLKIAERRAADFVFAGHNHIFERVNNNDTVYLNTGSFLSVVPSFATIDLDGTARLFSWPIEYKWRDIDKYFYRYHIPSYEDYVWENSWKNFR